MGIQAELLDTVLFLAILSGILMFLWLILYGCHVWIYSAKKSFSFLQYCSRYQLCICISLFFPPSSSFNYFFIFPIWHIFIVLLILLLFSLSQALELPHSFERREAPLEIVLVTSPDRHLPLLPQVLHFDIADFMEVKCAPHSNDSNLYRLWRSLQLEGMDVLLENKWVDN